MTSNRYIDFAYPSHKAAPHHFYVVEDEGMAYLHECLGASGGGMMIRARIGAEVFRRIRGDIKDHLNLRIKGVNATTKLKDGEAKLPIGKGWNKGDKTRIDRILGREVCVLFWALEGCPAGQESVVVDLWRTYRPEDLWWIFIQSDLDGRDVLAEPKGWRKALPVIFQKDVLQEA